MHSIKKTVCTNTIFNINEFQTMIFYHNETKKNINSNNYIEYWSVIDLELLI